MRHDAQRGFTLVELAIVVAIIGISIAGAMAGVSALRENTRLKQTNIALRDAEHALTLYVMQNGRLPFAAALGGDGTENGTSAYGEVPYDVLGLGRGDVTDGWGEVVRYAVDAAFAAGGSLPCIDNTLATNTETLGILDADSTEGDDTSFAKVAYVLISTGGDLDPEAPNDELEGDSNASFSLFRSEGIAANFDDIVTGRPANQILRDGGCRLQPKDTYSTEPPSAEYCAENPAAAGCGPATGTGGDIDFTPDGYGITLQNNNANAGKIQDANGNNVTDTLTIDGATIAAGGETISYDWREQQNHTGGEKTIGAGTGNNNKGRISGSQTLSLTFTGTYSHFGAGVHFFTKGSVVFTASLNGTVIGTRTLSTASNGTDGTLSLARFNDDQLFDRVVMSVSGGAVAGLKSFQAKNPPDE